MNVVTSDGLQWAMDGPQTDDHLGPAGHEANLEPLLRGLLGQGRLFLDVGAHVGRWSLRLAGQASHVIAVEANPVTAVMLRENIRLNGLEEKVTVLEVAAWDCRASLRLEDPNGKVRGGSTRVLPGGEETAAIPLDEALNLTGQDLGLVKLDVEGADLHALRGMRALLTDHRPSMLVERHDQYGYYKVEDLYELLASLGYEWTDGPEYMGAKYLICQPEEMPARLTGHGGLHGPGLGVHLPRIGHRR
jgi:FkbM family methyltransferase